MEARKITIVSTKDQTKKVIMSSATTLAELKADLRQNGIDYTNMTFFEGTSKTELKTDNSVLPHDVPWKGTTTNELVFMLTNTNKKIKSGAINRMDIYAEIKNMGLQEACLKRFGKNFTMCKTADLIALIEENKSKTSTQYDSCNDAVAREAITKLVEILKRNEQFDEYDEGEVLCILYGSEYTAPVKNDSQSDSPYSNDEIDAMFDDMDI